MTPFLTHTSFSLVITVLLLLRATVSAQMTTGKDMEDFAKTFRT